MFNDQLRKHIKPGIFDLIRIKFQKNKLGACGKHVYFEKNTGFLRYPENIKIGDNVIVKEGARICSCNNHAMITIGKNTTIGYHTFIFSSDKIKIGDDCLIAPFVYIVDSNHGIEKHTRINLQSNITSPVIIADDVWIGTGARILPGIEIGEGAVIAAGAVVNIDVPPYEIYGGIPAKKIGVRK
jgi:acetyltransferase-like isoleucine patch superfamily enzyme